MEINVKTTESEGERRQKTVDEAVNALRCGG